MLPLLLALSLALAAPAASPRKDARMEPAHPQLETIVLGGGCFWCLEAVFDEFDGVGKVVSGYSGGSVENPTYRQVCSGTTGHAEVVEVEFDPAKISLHDILRIFFTIHDPTTKDRQGADVGTQYRSAIFFRDAGQEKIAREVMTEIEGSKIWGAPLVTEVVPLKKFWPAEDYHQEYFAQNPSQPYCRAVIAPKVAKARKEFRDRLKKKG